MNSLNLLEYIKNGLILKNIESFNIFDTIIYENINNEYIENDLKSKIVKIFDNNCGFGINGELNYYNKKSKNSLIVIDKLSIKYLLPYINNSINDFTIINLGTGISGIGNKNIVDDNDIGLLSNYNINIYEPYDFNSLLQILKIKGNKYIRISNKELPTNLFENQGSYENINDIISFGEYGFTGFDGAIICGGYMIGECIDSIRYAQEKGKHYSLYAITNYNFNPKSINEIYDQEKIILILDQQKSSQASNFIKMKLFESKYFDGDIKVIYPNYQSVESINSDYIFESAKFNNNEFFKYLI